MIRRLLPSHVGPYRVEHAIAVMFFFFAVPPLLAPVLVHYPTAKICESIDGCQKLEGGVFDFEGVERGNAFRKVLKLKLAPTSSREEVADQIGKRADQELPWYWRMFPVRTPRVEVLMEKKIESGKGKRGKHK